MSVFMPCGRVGLLILEFLLFLGWRVQGATPQYFELGSEVVTLGKSVEGRWSADRARAWSAEQSFRLGANYIPSTCGNVLDMFDTKTFDSVLLTSEQELRIAYSAGFTTIRLFLHESLFSQRGASYLEDISRFLAVLQRIGMVAMLVLFDACWRPDLEDASVIEGVHNSAWVQCPTHDVLRAYASDSPWAVERLQRYVTDVVAYFANDTRVAVWDIYNEPSMRESEHWILPRLASLKGWSHHPDHWLLGGRKLEATFKLLRAAFVWARSAKPLQPLTAALWDFPSEQDDSDVAEWKIGFNQALLDMSDVVSLHCYCDPLELESRLLELEDAGRGAVLVTEFMARPRNSTLVNNLPILHHHKSWGYTWGLFNGRAQTHRHWETWVRDDIAEDAEWFHDVFFQNGTAYAAEEIKASWWFAVWSGSESHKR